MLQTNTVLHYGNYVNWGMVSMHTLVPYHHLNCAPHSIILVVSIALISIYIIRFIVDYVGSHNIRASVDTPYTDGVNVHGDVHL